jgi:hypothetical protein
MSKFNRKVLFMLFLVCLFALGAEIFYILMYGVYDTAEMVLEFLIMSFILTVSVYLISLIFKKSTANSQ